MSAERVLEVTGLEYAKQGEGPGALRDAVEEVIAGGRRFAKFYTGAKIYDRFGVQGIGWCEHGMGPSHGSVVLQITPTPEVRQQLQTSMLSEEQKAIALNQLGYLTDRLDDLMMAEARRRDEAASSAKWCLEDLLGAAPGSQQERQRRTQLDNAIRNNRSAARHLASLEKAREFAPRQVTT